jgi:pimeloyl-ACP methyl ester carboxylesterase
MVDVLVLHGLLADGDTAESQLRAMVTRIRELSGIGNVVTADWWPSSPLEPLQLIIDGRLGRRFWNATRVEVERQLTREDRHRTWVVVAYSAGGWIFYDWACRAPAAPKARVAAAFVIGAPWQVIWDYRYATFASGRHREIQSWVDLPADDIVKGLGGPIHTIFSNDDELVHWQNAAFPEVQVAAGAVVPFSLDGPTHRSLVVNDDILGYVVEQIRLVVISEGSP